MGVSAKTFSIKVQVYGKHLKRFAPNYRQYEKILSIFGSKSEISYRELIRNRPTYNLSKTTSLSI